jgi:hypothetical protein
MIPLPMSPQTFNDQVLTPALALLPVAMDSKKARVMLIAIGLQESRLAHRWQVLQGGGKGPARGLMQFEQGTAASRGGVWGVFLHPASRYWLSVLCESRGVGCEPRQIYAAIEVDDILAAGVARLLLFTDPHRLPEIDDVQGAWHLYANRTWRPGKPKPDSWRANHKAAVLAVS